MLQKAMPTLSYSLHKYDYAIYVLVLEVRHGLTQADPVLGKIRTVPTSHGGTIRQVTGPKNVETPMSGYSAEAIVDGVWVRKTDVDMLADTLWHSCQELISQIKKSFYTTFSDITSATGNVLPAQPGKNIWDAQIDAMANQDMRFDKDGNHGYEFIVHPSVVAGNGPPTAEQNKRLEDVIQLKRKEFNVKKRTRRLP